MKTLTMEEFAACEGLYDGGHAYVGATEVRLALTLADRGIVRTWDTVGGFSAWALTDEGRELVTDLRAKGRQQ